MATRAAVVGGFVLGGLALGVVAIVVFGGSRLFQTRTRAVIFFEGSVAGLEVGAPVTFRGVRLGSVTRIALDFSPATGIARIPVYIETLPDRITWEGNRSETDLRKLVTAGLRAQLAQQSFVTGQLRVDLDFRPDTPIETVGPETGPPEIPAIPSELERLRTTLAELPVRELVERAQRALTSIDRLATHLDRVVDPLAATIQGTGEAATRTLNDADDAVRRVQDSATLTLRSLEALTSDARKQLDGRGAELSRLVADADRAVRQADALVGSVNSLTAQRSAFRGDLEASVRDLSAAIGSLRTFARTIERDPSALLTGRTTR
ncbi:MAG TPA: MlaD family protein [Acetobacteraceae bacterium]|nr:MlaD family protein [Acetobacteraceae bacterium]